MIHFVCPFGHSLVVPDHRAGRKGRCPECHQRVIVPVADPRPSGRQKRDWNSARAGRNGKRKPADQSPSESGEPEPVVKNGAARRAPDAKVKPRSDDSRRQHAPAPTEEELAAILSGAYDAPPETLDVAAETTPQPRLAPRPLAPRPAPPQPQQQPLAHLPRPRPELPETRDLPALQPQPGPFGETPAAFTASRPALASAHALRTGGRWLLAAPAELADAARRQFRQEVAAARYLAVAMFVTAAFSLWPALGNLDLVQAPRWIQALVVLAVVQTAFAAWLMLAPDWSTEWAGMLFTALIATGFAGCLTAVAATPEGKELFLELDRPRMQVIGWCAANVLLFGMLSYASGAMSSAWFSKTARRW